MTIPGVLTELGDHRSRGWGLGVLEVLGGPGGNPCMPLKDKGPANFQKKKLFYPSRSFLLSKISSSSSFSPSRLGSILLKYSQQQVSKAAGEQIDYTVKLWKN